MQSSPVEKIIKDDRMLVGIHERDDDGSYDGSPLEMTEL